jgi:hypothetical protein
MVQFRFKSIERWPKEPTKARQRSRFDSSYNDTLKLLERELEHLGAREVFIHLWLPFGQIRQDGLPYANAKVNQPGVILSFTAKHGALEYPCDTFDDWRDNLRAIALALEALRKVDRYGVTSANGEQYTGWKKLPPAGHTLSSAAGVLIRHANVAHTSITRENFGALWRMAVQNTHPDKGGRAEDFAAVLKARDLIRAEKGWE